MKKITKYFICFLLFVSFSFTFVKASQQTYFEGSCVRVVNSDSNRYLDVSIPEGTRGVIWRIGNNQFIGGAFVSTIRNSKVYYKTSSSSSCTVSTSYFVLSSSITYNGVTYYY